MRLCLCFILGATLIGCQNQWSASPVASDDADLPVTNGLELQPDDYATVRSRFRTTLLQTGPSPQPSPQARPPHGTTVVPYRSGDLRLSAWVSRPPTPDGKHPAVLFLHGGFAFGNDDWEMAQPFRDAGFVVMAPLLRGENGLPGNFSMFYDEVDDVVAASEALSHLPGVDPTRIFLAGHSVGGTLTMLTAMTTDRFRAAASFSGSPDRIKDIGAGKTKVAPFVLSDMHEFQVRSPVAYATSFKCPTRLYYGTAEPYFEADTRRMAGLAKRKGLDVQAVKVPGDHMSHVPEAMKQAIVFFQQS